MATKPTIHGRDHLPSGADPIPGLGSSSQGGGSFDDYIKSLSGLRGYWRLGEAAAPFADTSGAVGGPNPASKVGTLLTTHVGGGIVEDDGAAEFQGTASGAAFLQANTAVHSGYENNMTVMAWAKPYGSTAVFRGGIYNNMTPGIGSLKGQALEMNWTGSSTSVDARFVRADGTISATSVTGLAVNTWYHLAASYDGATRKLYVNGALAASDADSHSISGAPWDVCGLGYTVAVGGSGAGPFYGVLDEVAFFGAVLTADEIAAAYNLGVNPAGNADEGWVQTADGSGGVTWAAPTVEVEPPDGRYSKLILGTNLSGTDNTDGSITITATGGGGSFDPATATTWWFPLVDSDGTCVLDSDGNLIPTLIPL